MTYTINPDHEGIAIIGMAGRFPQAPSLESFWEQLIAGKVMIQTFSDQELLSAGVHADLLSMPNYVRANGALADIGMFDAEFFGFSPREAQLLDPQQRLFLECAWSTLDHAGYDSETYTGAIAMYAGCGFSGYLINIYSNPDVLATVGNYQVMLLNDKDHLCTRTSYKLNLKGPSFTVQSSCSTSLVAVHQACQSLLDFQCDMALAGGVAVDATQLTGYLYHEGGINSPDGFCRPFDARANGTVGGSGLGLCLLKRLAEAIEDGDNVLAVIRGSAINNDGSDKVSYLAPSVNAQAEVVALALEIAEMEPDTITMIEAHGTGTHIGDPIEVEALTRAFRNKTDRSQFCALGSVKANIGHLDAAAGMAGFIKIVLAIQHRKIPPHPHFESGNPNIDFQNSPFYVPVKATEWVTSDYPLRAGLSSLGVGGTNAHIIFEEPPPQEPCIAHKAVELLPLSAKSPAALTEALVNLSAHLKAHPNLGLGNLAHTLQRGRKHFSIRRCFAVSHIEDALQRLAMAIEHPRSAERTGLPEIVFMFPGQGTQYLNMGADLYRDEIYFRQQVDLCLDCLPSERSVTLRKLVFAGGVTDVSQAGLLAETQLTQPALFILEYALAKCLMHWGIQPAAMIGHSIGEWVAACLAGVVSLNSALDLVCIRADLQASLPKGSMVAVHTSQAEAEKFLRPTLSLAAVNAPELSVLSGDDATIDQLISQLDAAGMRYRRLHTSHAFHSQMMAPVLPAFHQALSAVTFVPPQIPYVSNLTGHWQQGAPSAQDWVDHLREPVLFSKGIETLLEKPNRLMLEVGPGSSLATFVQQLGKGRHPISTLPGAQDQSSSSHSLTLALARLWEIGADLQWHALRAPYKNQRIPLPAYPFQRKHYWMALNQMGTPPLQAMPHASAEDTGPSVAEVTWKKTALRVPDLDMAPTSWLIFADDEGIGYQIKSRATQFGQQVVMVKKGESFAEIYDNLYAIAPDQPLEYQQLMHALSERGTLVQRVIFGWAISAQPSLSQAIERLGHLEVGLSSVAGQQQSGIEVGVLTRGAYAVSDDEGGNPDLSALIGLCLGLEKHSRCRFKVLDLDPRARQQQAEGWLIDQILLELAAPEGCAVAFRGNNRWHRMLTSLPGLEQSIQLENPGEAVCLVVGALDGPCQELAFQIAKCMKAPAILLHEAGKSVADHHGFESFPSVLSSPADFEKALTALRVQKGSPLCVLFFAPAHVVDNASCLAAIDAFQWLTQAAYDAGVGEGLLVCPYLQAGETYALAVREALCSHAAASPISWASAELRQPLSQTGEAGLEPGETAALLCNALTHYPGRRMLLDPARVGFTQPEKKGEQQDSLSLSERPDLTTAYRPPRTPREMALVGIIENQLGIQNVGLDDNFFELGGNSLTAVLIADRVSAEVGIAIKSNILLEHPTIAELLIGLEAQEATPLSTLKNDPIVAIQPRGNNPPMFFAHPAGGDVFCYMDLSDRLGDKQPFYGLSTFDLDEVATHHLNIEDMARHYVNAITEFQREGPYLIGGWSFGGFTAFEIVRQLQQAGKEVGMLVLLDTPAPCTGLGELGMMEEVETLMALGRELAAKKKKKLVLPYRLLDRSKEEQIEFILNTLIKMKALPGDKDVAWLRNLFKGYQSRLQAVGRYKPEPYKGALLLFRAGKLIKENFNSLPQEVKDMHAQHAFGWAPLVTGELQVFTLPATHESVATKPHAKAIAKRIQAFLHKVYPTIF